ncbi:PEBP (phosphatidylethanolamine-binding protein) family protein [Klebsormidium nitens]|uniref:PEBP (Phosphatidylethanolamine-binding protein) family protein n=1 Tax=Klebsormidium nitens TaxID=105231 RepID=A0A1Y1HU20_KLENI|nr:PEBP (phosphatidylethanolamine-binding protein) family protein [Klebsormidium nitens]|eukprot:GAQ82124.1 PEBP (phosphatidylethanolamine-binding protein) family protein [Klebsormidium nitens]
MAHPGGEKSEMAGEEASTQGRIEEQTAASTQGGTATSAGPRTQVEESSQTDQPAPSTPFASTTASPTLMSELEAAGIVPDVLDTFNPSAQLNLVFGTDKGTLQIENGERYASADLKSSPMLSIHENFVEAQSHLYTVVLVDLDSPDPTNPGNGEYLHWLVTNIPGPQATSDAALMDPAKVGKVVASYEPIQPKGDLPHRYAFVLFRQRPTAVLDIPSTDDRRQFKMSSFLMSSAVAAPVMAGYFTSSH